MFNLNHHAEDEINRLLYAGHEYGMCWVNHENQIGYINIPKNASSSTKYLLSANHWQISNFNDSEVKNYRFFCPLRDPLERWISGTEEFMLRYNICDMHHVDIDKEKLYIELGKLIIHIKTLDAHTAGQACFLPAEINNIDFLRVDHNYSLNLIKYFVDNGSIGTIDTNSVYYVFLKQKLNAGGRTGWKEILLKLLSTDKDVYDKLMEKLKEEYEFHNSCNFFN